MGSIHSRTSGIDGTFSGLQTTSQNRRQALEQHLAQLQQIENLLLEFAQRGLAFRVWLENADETLTDPITVETVEAVHDLENVFASFNEEKGQKEAEFHSLGDLAGNCKQLGVAETTYSEVSWASLQEGWNRVNGLISTRKHDLEGELARQQSDEQLRLDFAHKAQAFQDWALAKQHEVEHLSGDLQSQLSTLGQISQQIAAGQTQFHEVVAAQQALEDARVSDNPHTELSVEGLKGSWDAVNVLSRKKQQVLEKELLEQSGTGLSADQLREFKECFKHFDKDEDNLLSRLELGACLKSLGEDVNFDQGGKLDQILNGIDGDQDGKVTFEEFASYMERVSGGSDTPDSIKQAFKTLAGDKDYVTEADLRSVLPGDKVDYCLAHMKKYPGVDNAYDYNSFTDSLYGK
jgi:actinin alpha